MKEGHAASRREALSFIDAGSAREYGSAFGREIGRTAGSAMSEVGRSDKVIEAIGLEGVAHILKRADQLAEAGLDQTLVAAWTEAAAEAFNQELDQAAARVTAQSKSRLRDYRAGGRIRKTEPHRISG